MDAKDTVMELIFSYCGKNKTLAQVVKEYGARYMMEDARKAGIKEVVEWVEGKNRHDRPRSYYELDGLEWQAQLKEWGLH